jgi:hypothetical protein
MNPGFDAPIQKCDGRCGQLMRAFDALPRKLRDFFNDEARIQWCMCGALNNAKMHGAEKTLAHYRKMEAQWTDPDW